MRTPIVTGNWKMNPASLEEALELARAVRDADQAIDGVTTVICPPTVWLREVVAAVGGGALGIGAQTMHYEERGAYTGETSPAMLTGVAGYVILGHSERRQYDNETDDKVARKVAAAVRHGLRPIAAVGERAEQRRAGETASVVDRQVRAAISELDGIDGSGLVIAYEPVWAIGTGDAASPEDAQEVAAQIRAILRERDRAAADEVPIQYGGSVTPDNAAAFFAAPDIDGALVGGACLRADSFTAILRSAAGSAPR